jgi:hypothetical protein
VQGTSVGAAQLIYSTFSKGLAKAPYKLENRAASARYYGVFDAGFLPDNVSIQLTTTLTDGPSNVFYGLLFGSTDASFSEYYAFLISSDHHLIARVDKEGRHILEMLADNAVRAKPGGNLLRVDITGSLLRFIINNTEVSTHSVAQPVRGFVGFFLNGTRMSALFEPLSVKRLAVAPQIK